jgi:serine/threonine-protein kinase
MTNSKRRELNKFQLLKASTMIVVIALSMFALPAVRAEKTTVVLPQDDFYGAIAYSPSTRRFGSSWNYRSQTEAEQRALAICNRDDCQILLSLANSCGALAVARNGGYAWSDGGSLYEAKLLTSNLCTREFKSCKLICSVCAKGDVPY